MENVQIKKMSLANIEGKLTPEEMENIMAGRVKECGQYVVDCLGDVYGKHGWISVWAIVQSAFIPETAVALAAACYLDC